MRHAIIGTAGHVDHGKTRLIQALTGIDTDRLPEEKARGLTIELGFAPLEFPDGLQAGIVDVPGHEKFVRHMLCGAGGMDIALLAVASDEGFMPQTAEHLDILNLLGVREGAVVLTKADLTGKDQQERVCLDLQTRLRGTFLEGKPLFTVSAATGQGIPALKEHLHQLLLNAPEKDLRFPFRLPIDRVFTAEGFGAVVTGTLLSGRIRRDDPVEIAPAGLAGKVRGLQIFGQEVETASAGQRVAVNLSGLKKEEIRRGDTLVQPGTLPASALLDVRLELLASSRRCIRSGTQVRLHHGASARLARISLLERDRMLSGEHAYAQLRLQEPLSTRAGDRFVVRFLSPAETIGGGVILDPCPSKHKRNDPAVLESLAVRERGSLTEKLLQALTESGSALPDMPRLSRAMALPEELLVPALSELVKAEQVLEPLPHRYLACSILEQSAARCRQVLAAYHRDHPLQEGIRTAELRQKAGLDPETASALLALFAQDGTLQQNGDRWSLPGFQVRLTRRQESICRTVLGLCAGMGRRTPTPPELAAKFPLRDREDFHRVLEYLLSAGTLVLLSPDVLCHAGDLAGYRKTAAEWFESHETLTLAQFRDLLGTSRDYALLVLEYFDRRHMTKREGDLRRPGPVPLASSGLSL